MLYRNYAAVELCNQPDNLPSVQLPDLHGSGYKTQKITKTQPTTLPGSDYWVLPPHIHHFPQAGSFYKVSSTYVHLLNHFLISNFGFYKVNSKTSKIFNGQWSILPFSNLDIDNFLMSFAEFIQLDCDAGNILEEYHNFKLVNMRFRETILLNWLPHGGF